MAKMGEMRCAPKISTCIWGPRAIQVQVEMLVLLLDDAQDLSLEGGGCIKH